MTAQELKNSILQLAVQGKLINNEELIINNGETGAELLERIRTEKAKLIAEGKIKKEKDLPPIAEDEKSFDIPENWCWCRLGEIINIKSGDNLTAQQMEKGNIPVYGGNGVTGFHNKPNLLKETVVIGRVGFYCGSVHVTPEKSWVTDNAFITSYPEKYIDRNFLVFVLRHMKLGQDSNATAQPVVSGKKIYPMLFPLPPLAEQKAIVAKIEELLPYIEKYDAAYTKLEEFNKKFPQDMQKSILQQAVQGKLVPQDKADGNAKDLLAQIKAEKAKLIAEGKIKKEKPLAEITEDEIPFEIPENWCWCRLGEICNEIKRGKSPKYTDKSNYLAFAQKCNVKTGGINLDLALYLDKSSISRYSETDNMIQGDVVINSTGGGTMGRVGFFECEIPENVKGVYPDSHVTVIRSIGGINQKYLYFFLKSKQTDLEKMGAGSTNQTELKPATLQNLLIPLPPLAEQKRIVAKIEELLPLCKKLER